MIDAIAWVLTVLILTIKYIVLAIAYILDLLIAVISKFYHWYIPFTEGDTYLAHILYWIGCAALLFIALTILGAVGAVHSFLTNSDNDEEDDEDDEDDEDELGETHRSRSSYGFGTAAGALAAGLARNIFQGHNSTTFANSVNGHTSTPTGSQRANSTLKGHEAKSSQRRTERRERSSTPTVSFDSIDVQCRGIFREGDNFYMKAAKRGEYYTTRVHLGHKSNTGRKTGRVFNERYFVEWHRND